MRWLIGGEAGADVDLTAAYAWPDAGAWVRAMMVMSLDGVIAGPDGRSGSISSPTDRVIMKIVREASDVVLIGASTMRAERYSPMMGRSRIAIVSASLDLPWEERAFRESTHTPIVLTDGSAPESSLEIAREHADVMVVTDLGADAGAVVRALQERGLERIVCEGGAKLLGSLVEAGVVNEFDVAVSPLLMFEGQPLIDAHLARPMNVTLAHVIEDDGFIFTKYLT